MVLKLILKCLLFILIGWGFIEAIFLFNPYKKFDEETHFAASIIEKQKRLSELPSPKIVLVAGSNFAYGIDSKLMEDSLKMPVMNMSFQYFLGTDFLIRQVVDKLHKGDILVMGFEYLATAEGSLKEKLTVEYFYPPAKNWIEFENIDEEISARWRFKIDYDRGVLNRYFFLKTEIPFVEDTYSVFFRKALNERGDLISHLNNPDKPYPNDKLDEYYQNMKSAIKNMNYYTEILNKKGVKVFYTFPPYNESSYELNKTTVNNIYKRFENAKFVVLDKPTDLVYPDSYFHDLAYHLNAKGRTIRTNHLIRVLKQQLQ